MTNNNFSTPPILGENNRESVRFSLTNSQERSIFTKVFAWMGGALFLTAVVSMLFVKLGLANYVLASPTLMWLLIIAQFILVMVLNARIWKMSFASAATLMIIYSILNGTTLSFIFFVFSLGTIARVFFITAGMFGVMAVLGATIKRDLSPLYSYLMMFLLGLIIAIVVNLFVQSTALDWLISVLGVIVFTILTAVDTSRIKRIIAKEYEEGTDVESIHKVALIGSLQLYLDFINLFIYLLRLLGRD